MQCRKTGPYGYVGASSGARGTRFRRADGVRSPGMLRLLARRRSPTTMTYLINCLGHVLAPRLIPWVGSRERGHRLDGAVFPPCSSNRSAGFPASGFPTGFIALHTAEGHDGHTGGETPRAPNTASWLKRLVPRVGTL